MISRSHIPDQRDGEKIMLHFRRHWFIFLNLFFVYLGLSIVPLILIYFLAVSLFFAADFFNFAAVFEAISITTRPL